MATYLGKIKMLIKKLRDLGLDHAFIKNVIITKISCNFPKKYDPLLTMWNSVWDEEKTLHNLLYDY